MDCMPDDEALFKFILYLVSCARLSLEEPPIYGSFRLIDGASRLIASAEETDGSGPDEFLRAARAEIEREKIRTIDDEPGYTEWLDGLLRRFAREGTRRNLEHELPNVSKG